MCQSFHVTGWVVAGCFPGQMFHIFSLLPPKAGRRMGVRKQSPCRSPPLPRIRAQPPPLTRATLSSMGHNQNPRLARERPGLKGGGAEGTNSALHSRCFVHEPPLPSVQHAVQAALEGAASTPAPPGGRLTVSPPHLHPCQGALAHLCCHLKEQPAAPRLLGHHSTLDSSI